MRRAAEGKKRAKRESSPHRSHKSSSECSAGTRVGAAGVDATRSADTSPSTSSSPQRRDGGDNASRNGEDSSADESASRTASYRDKTKYYPDTKSHTDVLEMRRRKIDPHLHIPDRNLWVPVTPQMLLLALRNISPSIRPQTEDSVVEYIMERYPLRSKTKLQEEVAAKLRCACEVGILQRFGKKKYKLPLRRGAHLAKLTSKDVASFWRRYHAQQQSCAKCSVVGVRQGVRQGGRQGVRKRLAAPAARLRAKKRDTAPINSASTICLDHEADKKREVKTKSLSLKRKCSRR